MSNVVGPVAEPIAVAGLATWVPPEIFRVAPAVEVPPSTQVVVKIKF